MSPRRAGRGSRVEGRGAGFTLVELMVALALGAMIALAIAFISKQAQEVYEATSRKVEVYNKFRFALLSVTGDFARWIPTSNLEFFADGRGANARRNENWDEGEELPDTSDQRGPGVVNGGDRKEFDEFAYIVQRQYVEESPDGPKIHDAYQAYFRTMTYIDGRTREANVEYMLVDPSNLDSFGNPQPPVRVTPQQMRDLTLYKVVRYHDIKPEELQKPTANFPIARRWVEVCSSITDFRIEYTTDNRFDNKVSSGFRTPQEDFQEPSELMTRPERLESLEGAYKKTFGYGTMKLQEFQKRFEPAIAFRSIFGDRQLRSDHRPVRFGFEQNPKIKFAELTPGDGIYIYTESARGGNQGGGAGVAGNVGTVVQFPAGNYTVKTNIAGKLELREDIDSSTWTRDPTGVRYKAAFLPDAIRITMRVVDEAGKDQPNLEAKTLQKVIWIRQKAR